MTPTDPPEGTPPVAPSSEDPATEGPASVPVPSPEQLRIAKKRALGGIVIAILLIVLVAGLVHDPIFAAIGLVVAVATGIGAIREYHRPNRTLERLPGEIVAGTLNEETSRTAVATGEHSAAERILMLQDELDFIEKKPHPLASRRMRRVVRIGMLTEAVIAIVAAIVAGVLGNLAVAAWAVGLAVLFGGLESLNHRNDKRRDRAAEILRTELEAVRSTMDAERSHVQLPDGGDTTQRSGA